MREWILGMIAAVMLTTAPAVADFNEYSWDSDQYIAYTTFVHACAMTAYRCDGLVVPQVRQSTQLPDDHIRGLYQGGHVLWVSSTLEGIQRRLTIFHEMVHYLQFEGGKANVLMVYGCVVEREAMEYTNQYVNLNGFADEYLRELEEWKRTYGC